MPIRVLQVVTYMGRGGLETMLMNYYRNIDRSKVQFDFLVHRDFTADYDAEILALGGKIYRLPRLNPFSPTYRKKLDAFFKEHPEYKIVHSHLDCMAGIPLKYAKANGVPHRIAHAHSNNQAKDKKYLLKLFYKRNIPAYATKLFACSREAGEWMFGGADFSVMNNAIDAKQYSYQPEARQSMRESLGIPQDALVVGHVGRFAPEKNHSFLIDIFAELVKVRPNSRLLLVGAGDLQVQMQEKVVSLGIGEQVIFAGLRSDVPQVMQAVDVFVMPSLFEGLGIANIEAQAAGLPCLISDKVPIECEKTSGLVRQIPLTSRAEKWATEILKVESVQRRNTYDEIKQAGFDICENAQRLEHFYLDHMESGDMKL